MRISGSHGNRSAISHCSNWLKCVLALSIALAALAAVSCGVQEDREVTNVDLSRKTQLQATNDEPKADKVFLFGMGHRQDPIEQDKIYTPFMQYLERETGYQFELRFFAKDFESCFKGLGEGSVDFAILGPVCSIKAQKQFGSTRLASTRTPVDLPPKRTAVITRPGSGIKTIEDLRGRSVAFTCPNCVLGHHSPRDMFLDHGITLQDLEKYAFLGSCERCAEKVISGAFDVGCIEARVAEVMEKKGQIKIIAVSEKGYPTASIDASRDVDPNVAARVKSALLSFDPQGKDKDGLYRWERSRMPAGFVEPDESIYQDINEMIQRFGLAEEGA